MKKQSIYSALVTGLCAIVVGFVLTPCANGQEGPISHWDFDEGSGGTLYDDVGGNNGTISGATWISGVGSTGHALQFDGTNDYVEIANPSKFGFANQSFTFTAWVQIEDNTNYSYEFITIGDAGDCYPLAELGKSRSGASQGRIFMEISPNGVLVYDAQSDLDGSQLPKNQWIFVAGVADWASAQIKLHLVYLDGVLHTTVDQLGSFNLLQQPLKVKLGAFPCAGGYHKGLLDEVRIYDRALSEGEILDLYNNPGGNQPPTAVIDNITPNPAGAGQEVTFTGHGTDPDGSIVGWSWRSSIDGQLSSQASFSTSSLSAGAHTIYFKVQDDDGEWSAEDADTLYIYDLGDYSISWNYPQAPQVGWMGRREAIRFTAEYTGEWNPPEPVPPLIYGLEETCVTEDINYTSDPQLVFEPYYWGIKDYSWGRVETYYPLPLPPPITHDFAFCPNNHWDWIEPFDALSAVIDWVLFVTTAGASEWKNLVDIIEIVLIDPTQWWDYYENLLAIHQALNISYFAEVRYSGIGHAGEGTPFTVHYLVPHDKIGLLSVSVATGISASVSTLICALCGLPCCFWALPIEVVLMATSQLSYIAAYDPDSNYTEFVNPEFIYPSDLDSIADPEAHAIAYNAFTGLGYMKALKNAFAKYYGALQAGDTTWSVMQLSAVQTFSKATVQYFADIPVLLESAITIPTPEQMDSIRNGFATSGLPAMEQRMLLELGYSQSEIDAIGATFAGLSDDFFYGMDTIPMVLQKALNQLDTLAKCSGPLPGNAMLSDLGITPDTVVASVSPGVLNCWVEFPDLSSLSGFGIISARLNDSINAIYISPSPGDYDADGVPDIAMTFDLSQLMSSPAKGQHLLSVFGQLTTPEPDTVLYSGAAIITAVCNCEGFCDLNLDGGINPVDVVKMVNYVYKSIDQRQQIPNCPAATNPNKNGDWNCDGAVNPPDVVRYVNFVYKGQTNFPPCDPCAP